MTGRFPRPRVGSDTLQAMVDELAEDLGRSVVVNDPLVRLICSSRHFGDADPVRVRSLLQGRADSEVIRFVLAQGVAQWSRPGHVRGRDDIGLLPRYCVPLRERGHLLGLLMVIDAQQSLTPEEVDTIMVAARAMAAQMYTERLADDAEETGTNEALLDLLSGSPAGRGAARQRLLGSGPLRDAPHAVVSVVEVSGSQEPSAQVEMALRGALEAFRHTRSARGVLAVDQGRAILLQLLDRPPGREELDRQSTHVLEALGAFLGPPAAFVVGVGGRQAGPADAWVSYGQALVAARAARRLPSLKGVGHWEELGEFAILLQLPEESLNASLVPEPLRTLMDSNGGSRHRETLRCFLEHAGSIPRTAEALQIHRTSLYYRLGQIQEITGLDLDIGAHRLLLHMGLRIEELLAPEHPAELSTD
ncbi:PucR family transcriptional regulator [Streptomyces albicerus]|uniref:PucR family transcriptional regulator n=1 Tax=Streptomyces albicerus TaxID=2569859 RepID=UPI00124AE8FE|nr:helix-turn-helix domain-containing protein [Streptomyces albicerus]